MSIFKSDYQKKMEIQKEKAKRIKEWLPADISRRYRTLEDFGHFSKMHLNKTDDFLKQRILDEDVRFSSSFYGKDDEIIRMLRNILMESIDEIAEYLANREDDKSYELYGDIPKSISAHGYKKLLGTIVGPEECSEVEIIIRKTGNLNNFYVMTIFPVNLDEYLFEPH